MQKNKSHMLRYLETNRDRNIELIKIYQAGKDWVIAKQTAIEKIKAKYENKLVKARMSGCSAAKLAAIYRELENALATDPTLVKLDKMAKTMPRPTTKQKFDAEDAANELIKTNENLVIFIIRKHFNTYIDPFHFDEMTNVGRYGMFQSLMSYDPNKGAFSTHAAFFIKHEIYGYLCERHNMSPHYLSQARRYNDAVAKLLEEGNATPSASDIADEMGIGINAARRLIDVIAQANPISLNNEDALNRPIEPLKFNPEEIAANNEYIEEFYKALDDLSPKHRFVINCLFLENDKPVKLSEIGVRLAQRENPDVPESELEPYKADKIRQIRNEALRDLKKTLTDYDDDELGS